MTGRPQFADFDSRIGTTFTVNGDHELTGTWTLQSVKKLDAPDEDGLRDLEFFSLTFLFSKDQSFQQGTYLIEDHTGFRQTLFASPFRQDKMIVTVA
ncbi:MAG: DUF6916 family protein [Verrucomicrobiaceae bacterium]